MWKFKWKKSSRSLILFLSRTFYVNKSINMKRNNENENNNIVLLQKQIKSLVTDVVT